MFLPAYSAFMVTGNFHLTREPSQNNGLLARRTFGGLGEGRGGKGVIRVSTIEGNFPQNENHEGRRDVC